MKIISITAHVHINYDHDRHAYFQLKCGDTVLIEEEVSYESDGDDLELWAAEKLKGLFK